MGLFGTNSVLIKYMDFTTINYRTRLNGFLVHFSRAKIEPVFTLLFSSCSLAELTLP